MLDPRSIASRRHTATMIVRLLVLAGVLWAGYAALRIAAEYVFNAWGVSAQLVLSMGAAALPTGLPAIVLLLIQKPLVRWLVPAMERGEVCPKCGYSLKNLRSPVCPECGTDVRPPAPPGR